MQVESAVRVRVVLTHQWNAVHVQPVDTVLHVYPRSVGLSGLVTEGTDEMLLWYYHWLHDLLSHLVSEPIYVLQILGTGMEASRTTDQLL